MLQKHSPRVRVLVPLIVLNILFLAFAAIYAHVTASAIEEGRELISCYIKHSLGIYCPGCGGSRAVIALFELDIIKSLKFNPLPFLMLLIVLYADILALASVIKNSFAPIKKFKLNILILIPITAILFFLLRIYFVYGLGIDFIGDILG